MTTAAESKLLTQVGPGTAMGELFRQYWFPALKSSEVEADGDPKRLRLLGENLVAFRDSSGQVGVMDHRCPHRCASLFFGRNEEGGLRCVYHGWKFAADGTCVDMANIPPHQDFKHKVRAKAYATHEANGVVWVFMGDQANVPPTPVIEPTLLPEDEVRILFVQRECNYLQALEGDIDTSHIGFLHFGNVDPMEVDRDHMNSLNITDVAPEYEVTDAPWGTMYGAHRPGGEAGPGQTYWRFAHFLFPFWTYPPDGDFRDHIVARAWVPMDDEHTMFVHVSWNHNKTGLRTDKLGNPLPGLGMNIEFLADDPADWLGRFRTAQNQSNDFKVDRDAYRNGGPYSGIDGLHMQDQMITESMGGITDHTFEHLAPSDRMITQTRKRLVNAARAFKKTGAAPPGAMDPEVVLGARAGDFLAPEGQDWRDAYEDYLRQSTNPTGKLVQAQAAE